MRLIEILAPERGDLVALLEAYFDESYGPDGVVCVAGYVFTKSRAQALDKAWRAMLERYCLPFFRMSACAGGGDPFAGLTMDQRISCEKEAIALIHRNALHGVAATVDPLDLAKVKTIPDVGRFSTTPYEFCVWHCVTMVAMWAREKRPGVTHSISYIFESGDTHQAQANAMMNFAAKTPIFREFAMYGGHGFLRKEKSRPTQAADLLAWQWFTDSKKRAERPYKPRKDLQALLDGGVHHSTLHADENYLSQMVRDLRRTREGKPMFGFSSSGPRS